VTTAWKPEAYSTVSPYLVVLGAEREIAFMKAAFGGSELRRFDTPDGSVLHAEVRIGDTVIMIGDAGGDWPPVPCFLHVYVTDVDDVYRRALAAGGESVEEPNRKDGDTDRRGGVRSPGGNTWWMATQME